jgi:hypothetical protein
VSRAQEARSFMAETKIYHTNSGPSFWDSS